MHPGKTLGACNPPHRSHQRVSLIDRRQDGRIGGAPASSFSGAHGGGGEQATKATERAATKGPLLATLDGVGCKHEAGRLKRGSRSIPGL